MNRMRPRSRIPVLLVATFLASCGGRERVAQRLGDSRHWHLERVTTSALPAWLLRWPLVARLAADERWWFVSPTGERSFLRLMDYVSADAHSPADYMKVAVANVQAWGFNGFGFGTAWGKWSDEKSGLPNIDHVDFSSWGCDIWKGVFEGWHADLVDQAVASEAKGLKDRTDALGLLWEYSGAGNPRKLLMAYASWDADSPTKQALVAIVRKRCGNDLARLHERMPTVRDFEALAAKRDWDQYEQMDGDAEELAAALWAKQGAMAAASMHARTPQYLNLGPVISDQTPLSIVKALAPYVDVFSYDMTTPDGRLPRRYLEEASRLSGRPIMIVDFGMTLKISTRSRPGVETEAGQAICYRRTAGAAAALPFMVGVSWAGYDDTESQAWGFLDRTGAQRSVLISTARETNAHLDEIHRAGAGGFAADYFEEDRFAGGRPRQEVDRLPATLPVDGELANWPTQGFWFKEVKLTRDLDPVVFLGARIGWDDEGLVLGFQVRDDAVELLDPRVYWRESDYIEVFLDGSGKRPAAWSPACYHLVLLPRGGGADGADALALAMHHPGDRLAAPSYDFRTVRIASSFFRGVREFSQSVSIGRLVHTTRVALPESAWKLCAKVPWSLLGVTPKPGVRLGFNLIAHRMGQREEDAFWAMPRVAEGMTSPRTWGELVLKDPPK